MTTPGEQLEPASMEGFNLSAEKARALEERIKLKPADAEARATLLGYYFTRRDLPDAAKMQRELILWMIENRPADSFSARPFCQIDPILDAKGFAQARDLWLKQVNNFPMSAPVLVNAARFQMLSNPRDAESLFGRAILADPKNPQWSQELGELHMRSLTELPAADRAARAHLAATEFEKAIQLTANPQERFYLLSNIAKAEFAGGDMAKAGQYADQLLTAAKRYRNDWNYGNAIYDGNTMLGRIALAAGDVPSAKSHLLAAAQTPGSPQLNSFGPNVTLARDLLAKGERETVIQYLDLCGKFWQMGADRLKKWRQAVTDGGTPGWEMNLNY